MSKPFSPFFHKILQAHKPGQTWSSCCFEWDCPSLSHHLAGSQRGSLFIPRCLLLLQLPSVAPWIPNKFIWNRNTLLIAFATSCSNALVFSTQIYWSSLFLSHVSNSSLSQPLITLGCCQMFQKQDTQYYVPAAAGSVLIKPTPGFINQFWLFFYFFFSLTSWAAGWATSVNKVKL